MEAAQVSGGIPAMGGTGGSAGPEPGKRSRTMQDVLSEIQDLVEKGDVINRTQHVDLNWYLQSSPGEAEIRLVRTVQKVLACRYQPARLDVTAMAKQLEEAEDYKRSVLDQVAQMKETGSARVCDPSVLKRVEAQWSAALLDASATVQVKAAQLDQVKCYHKQMKMAKAFLEVVAMERDKMSLNVLGSSALQAVKLQALLNTMAQKKNMWPELLRLSSQFSVHLSEAESSGALLAQLGDVQDEWRVLEGSIKRALQHASNSTSQASGLIKEVKQLKDKVEAVQESLQSSLGPCDTKGTLELHCLTTDLKLYNQLHLHLKSQSDALIHFSLGQKEKEEIKGSLLELGTLLNATNFRLNSMFSTVSLTKMSKHFQDLIIWAKQAEHHISVGKKLALFPEEARVQIVEMKKFQTDILTRRSKIQVEVEEMKAATYDMVNEDHDQVLKTIEDLYEAITDSLDHVLNTMKKNLQEREKLLSQLANMDAWLAETHAKRDPCIHVENLSKADIGKLQNELKIHKLATAEIENQLQLVEAMEKTSKETAIGLSPGESRYLVNRLSGLWTELDGMLAHERATSWELEELIHERTSSDEELSNIWESLRLITMDLEQQKFPLTEETLSAIAQYKRLLMEHQCEVQEIQHCKEAKRSSLLCTIGELQDRCKAFSNQALEQGKYLHLRKQMEDSRDIAEEQIQRASEKTLSLGERFRLCQVLLVELPLVKTQCQEAADQLEAIAPELNPSELNSERQRIHHTVETLVSWENSVLENIKHLETKLILGLRFSSELPALTEVFQRARLELQGAEPVSPDEKAIDVALRRCWVIWRNMESGMRVLEAMGRREKMNLKNLKELYSLRDSSMQECRLQMEGLSQARESLKDYQWAAQGAIGFLHNAETTFLSAPGGFLDCTDEQRQTQQAIEALEDGFQAHICHLGELVPKQPCLSRPKTEQLHTSILSQLLVGRAVLEAQAQLRLESLQRCEVRQESHKSCHEDVRQRLSGFESDLSECAAEHVTSYDKCIAQHKRAMVLMEDLRGLARNIEELKAGCPMHGCAVGKGGELGALWRRWVSLRRGIGLFMAHTEQRGEEWRDITTSMEQCCSLLASLQAEVPDSSAVSFTQEKPQKLLAQAEMHQAGLEQEQQALASLEHRLEHALSLSSSQDPISPGPVGKTLVKIQENVRSLKERNLLVVAAAQAEEKERQQVEEKMEEVERHILDILPMLETCSDPLKQQEYTSDLFSQKAKMKAILDGMQIRYTEIPADISRRIQGIQQSLQGAEEKLKEKSDSVRKLAGRVAELGSGLEKVKALLETKSSDVSEAQNTLKRVWDELDMWHSRLMLLENEVQDVAEDQPEQAHLLMDQLMQPLQLYQSAAQMAEQRTAFLSKIPACLQEFEDILHSATCWSDEARSWLKVPVSFTTARSLQNHANSLQLVVDDSERIRDALQNFRPVLAEISTVCDISLLESRLKQRDEEVHTMQKNILEPLDLLLHAVVVVEDMEAEILCMEKNIPKIRAILSSMDNSSITLSEHLLNRQVILANVQSMQKTLEEMQSCKAELRLPQRGEDGLVVFNKTGVLLQSLTELEELTQQQEAQLQDQIRLEAKLRKDYGVAASPHEETPQQECNSEEEGSEEDSSYLSSSSDTLTCSIPEDPDDTLNYSDLQSLCDVTGTRSLDPLGSEVNARSKGADGLELPPVTSELEIKNLGPAVMASTTMDSDKDPQLDTTETFLLKTASYELPALPPAEEQLVNNAATQNHLSRDRGLTDMPVAAEQAVAEESTALLPERPIIPLSVVRTSASLGGREQSEVGSTDRILADESKPNDESPEVQSGSDYEGDQQRWHCLRAKISQKLSTLVKVQEEQQAMLGLDNGAANGKVPDVELLSTGSASAVLQQTSESMDLLKSTVNSAGGAREGVYVAAQRVLLCLDSLTDLLLTPRASAGDEAELKLMQLQCVSGELKDLCSLLGDVESESRARLEGEEPDAVLCLTSLQQCLQTAQLILTGAQSQTVQHLELQNAHQGLFSDQLCSLEEFELGPSEIFPNLKKEDAASIEQCMLGRHQSEWTGEEELALQRASHSLLQGIAGVLELAEGWMMEEKMMCSSSSSQLQSALSKHKKLSQLLASQLAFAERLFHCEPEVLRHQEDERVQLEVRAKAWQQQALQQEVAAQGRLQEWLCWEDSCGRLSRMLDELEGYISGGEPEGEEEEDTVVQSRAEACQQTLLQLDESRASVGLMLDQGSQLQADAAKKTGGALELRWRNVRRRTEREIQRCRDIQESRASFQTDSAHVGEWLLDANKRLKTWLDLAGDTEPNPASVRRSLIELLEFSSEIEAASAQRTSASRAASRLLHLRDADCPRLRADLAKLEVGWSQLTSDLSTAQDALQQRLLAVWPLAELLSDMEIWMKKLEERQKQEREALLKAKDAAEMWRSLRRHQKLKAGMLSAQVLLDFLSQMGPQVSDVQVLRSERTAFAEQLGALRLRWLHLQGELESQIRRAEQIHHTCADRERKLQRLSSSVERRQKQLNQWKRAGSRTLAHRALLELQAVLGNLKEEAKALQELRATPWLAGDEEAEEKERPYKVAFSAQAECVAQAFEDLSQQVEALQPALQQTVEEWAHLHKGLRDVSLLTTRVRCALHCPTTPLLSMQQTQRYLDFLPCLQETTGEAEQLWAGLDESYQNLKANLHPATAETLRAKIEGDRERWSEALRELCEEQRRSRETLSLWQEHERLSHSCSHRLEELQGQWVELQRGDQVTPQALEMLQGAAEDLQSSVGDVLTFSKPLVGRLEPLAASLVQSQTRLLSRDILLLSQDTSARKKSLQEDEAQQRELVSQLEKLEKQIQNILPQKKAGATHKDSVKQLSELSELFPLLLDTLDASRWQSLSDQQAETLRRLSTLWNTRASPMCDAYRNQLRESQRSLDIEHKCVALTSVLEELEKLESTSRQPKNYSYPQKILSDCQKLQMDVMAGQQLFQGLSCDAVILLEKQTGEERSELLAQVSRLRERWFRSVSLIAQWKVSAKEQLKQWRIYQRGSKLLWKLLRDVGPLLPPPGPVRSTLQQLRSHAADCQCVEDALRRHAPVYTQTLEAGRHLCDSVTEPESLIRLQSELQAIDEAWRSSNSLLEKTGTLINTTTQKWSQCQDRITSITSELDMLKAELKKQLPAGAEQTEEEEKLIQKTGHSLQLLSGGLGELVTMKSDLSQYVAAGDSALLEQQLEQLHGQWEELCSKVSLRRQEIADRLNAWTIFNDKNKEFCDWLTQMENKVCHSGELSIEEMVEKLKKDCMEEINLFSENKSHLKQLGEQLLLASDEAKQTQVRGSLQELNQRWHGLFHQIEARVRKLKETLVTVQQLDKNMSNLRSWLSRIEAELSRPVTYSVCHHQEIQKRLAEQQELQRDIEQHTEGVASVLSLCDVLLRDEDAAAGSGGAGSEAESDSLQETSRSLDQRWRTICALALDRRLRIEETWRLWCKFLDDYSRFEDWLKMAERTAANPNTEDVLYTVAKEELKKFEGFQRQVHERLTQLEMVNNQYRRLARENRTDRSSQLKAMVHEGNRRWDALHRRAAAILRRLKYFTSQREEFESTRESMLVWLTELDLQLTNVEHFSESDVHHKIQQLNSFQKEITLNTERIDGLIVFGEGLIQRSTPSDAVLIEEELEELHSYCQDVFSRLVRFHQRLSQPPAVSVEPELSGYKFSLESSLELIGRPWLGRSQGSLPATPSHLLASPLERSGRETPVSVDSLPLEWDHTGDVGGSSSHEDEEEEEQREGLDEDGTYFSAISEAESTLEDFVEAAETHPVAAIDPSCSMDVHGSPKWRSPGDGETEAHVEAQPTLTSTPLKQGYLRLMSQCSGSIESIKRVSLILDEDDDEVAEDRGLTRLRSSDKQSGVIERWELLQAQSRSDLRDDPQEPQTSDLEDLTSWLEGVIPQLERLQQADPGARVDMAGMEDRAKELKEMQKAFARYKSIMLSVNLRALEPPEQQRLGAVNRDWSRACTGLQQWDTSLRRRLMRCQEFHETLHSLLLWLAHADSRRYAVDVSRPDTPAAALRQHLATLTSLQEELRGRQAQQAALQALWAQLQPDDGAQESAEAQEKIHVTGCKLKLLLREVGQELSGLQRRLDCEPASAVGGASAAPQASHSKKSSPAQRARRESSPRRSFFSRVLRAAFPLHLLLLLLLLLPCLLLLLTASDHSCSEANNFARSFYPMLRYTNGPPPT